MNIKQCWSTVPHRQHDFLDGPAASETWHCPGLGTPEDLLNEDGEIVVKLADGHTLRSGCMDPPSPRSSFVSGEYVRLCAPDGEEIIYWSSDEWEHDPILVMGAIINSAAGFRLEKRT